MKKCITYSIIGALFLLVLRALFPDYIKIILFSYLLLPFTCDKMNMLNKWLIFYLPFFIVHSLPTIIHLYVTDKFFLNSFALNYDMQVVNVLMPASILGTLYIQKYKYWGLAVVLVTIISILPGFFSKSLQILLAGSLFLILALFFPFDEKLPCYKRLVIIYLPFFIVFSLSFIYEPIFAGISIDFDRSQIIPIDLTIPAAILIGLIIRNTQKKLLYTLSFVVLFGFLGYMGYPNYFTWLDVNNSYTMLPKIKLKTLEEKEVIIDTKNKEQISVLYIWSAHCGVCFKKMPDYNKLVKQFKNNKLIKFYAVYLTLNEENISKAHEIKAKYDFDVYLGDDSFRNALEVNYVPRMLIAQGNKIIYYGSAVFDRNNLYNSARTINKLIN